MSTQSTVSILVRMIDQLTGPAGRIRDQIKGMHRDIQNITRAFGPLTATVSGLIATWVSFRGLQRGIDLQQQQIQYEMELKRLLGDNNKLYEERIKKSREIAGQTTFAARQILQVETRMRAMGVTGDMLETSIQAVLGRTAAGITDLDTNIRQIGRTFAGYGGELQETEPIVRDLTRAQLLAGKAAELMAEKYWNAATRIVNTDLGRKLRAQIAVDEALMKLGDVAIRLQATLLPGVARALDRIVVLLDSPGGKVFLDTLTVLARLLADNIEYVGAFIGVWMGLKVVLPLLSIAGRVWRILFSLPTGVLQGLAMFGRYLLVILAAVVKVVTHGSSLRLVLYAIFSPGGIVLLGIAAVITAWLVLSGKLESTKKWLSSAWKLIKDVLGYLADGTIALIDIWESAKVTLGNLWEWVKMIFKKGWEYVSYTGTQVGQLWMVMFRTSQVWMAKIVQVVMEMVTVAITELVDMINDGIEAAAKVAGVFSEESAENLRKYKMDATTIFSDIGNLMVKQAEENLAMSQAQLIQNAEDHEDRLDMIEEEYEAAVDANDERFHKESEARRKAREDAKKETEIERRDRLESERVANRQIELLRENSLDSIRTLAQEYGGDEYVELYESRVAAEKAAAEEAMRLRRVTTVEGLRQIEFYEKDALRARLQVEMENIKRLTEQRRQLVAKGEATRQVDISLTTARIELLKLLNELDAVHTNQRKRLRDTILEFAEEAATDEEKIEEESLERRYRAKLVSTEQYLEAKDEMERKNIEQQIQLAKEEMTLARKDMLSIMGEALLKGEATVENQSDLNNLILRQQVLQNVVNLLNSKLLTLLGLQKERRGEMLEQQEMSLQLLDAELAVRRADVGNDARKRRDAELQKQLADQAKERADAIKQGATADQLAKMDFVHLMEQGKLSFKLTMDILHAEKELTATLKERMAIAREDVQGRLTAALEAQALDFEKQKLEFIEKGATLAEQTTQEEIQRYERSKLAMETLMNILEEAEKKLDDRRDNIKNRLAIGDITGATAAELSAQALDEFREAALGISQVWAVAFDQGILTQEHAFKIAEKFGMLRRELAPQLADLAKDINDGLYNGLAIDDLVDRVRQKLKEMQADFSETSVAIIASFVKIQESLAAPLKGFFMDLVTGAKSFEEAASDMALGFANALLDVIMGEAAKAFLKLIMDMVLRATIGEQAISAVQQTESMRRIQQTAMEEQAVTSIKQAGAAQRVPTIAGEAGAEAAKSQAATPWIGPTLAIAAMGAVFAAIMAFALRRNTGGFVGRIDGGAGGMMGRPHGPDQDTFLIAGTSGEHITNRRATAYYGPEVMNAINRMLIPRGVLAGYSAYNRPPTGFYNSGGLVAAGVPTGNSPQFIEAVVSPTREHFESLMRAGGDAIFQYLSEHPEKVRQAARIR